MRILHHSLVLRENKQHVESILARLQEVFPDAVLYNGDGESGGIVATNGISSAYPASVFVQDEGFVIEETGPDGEGGWEDVLSVNPIVHRALRGSPYVARVAHDTVDRDVLEIRIS